jgi:hypothetical protein
MGETCCCFLGERTVGWSICRAHEWGGRRISLVYVVIEAVASVVNACVDVRVLRMADWRAWRAWSYVPVWREYVGKCVMSEVVVCRSCAEAGRVFALAVA